MNRTEFWALGATVVSLGAALRLHGLDWGLPWALHIDERLFVVAKAIRLERSLEGTGLPEAGITSYGILPLWLLVLARKLFLGAVTQPGPPTYGDAFAGTVLLARGISALWSIATIVLVAVWARRWGRPVAWLAAAFAAGFPALVQAAHFGTVEAPLVALMAGGMIAAERLAERPAGRAAWGRVLACGALLGLAVSVKAPGALLVLPMLHAALAPAGGGGRPEFRPAGIGRAGALVAVAAAAALALNPGLLSGGSAADYGEHTTLSGNLQRAYSADFHDWTLPYAADIPVWTELTVLLPWAAGPVPAALGLAGMALLLLRRRQGAAVRLLLLALPLALLLLPARVKTVRFLLPALPALAVAGAIAAHRLTARGPAALCRPAIGVIAVAALVPGVAFTAIYAETDSRVAAAEWLDANVGEREIVVVEDPPGYGPPLGSPSPDLVRPPLRYELLWRNFYTEYEKLDAAGRREHIDRVLRRATWLVLSEGHRAEFTTVPELRPVESAWYRELDAGRGGFEKVKEFKSYPRIGPWMLRDDGAEVLQRVFDHPRIEIWKRKDAS